MYDFTFYSLQELFKIRDALVILASFELENKDMMREVNQEINEREKPLPPENPDHERP